MQELKSLSHTAGVQVVETVIQTLISPNSLSYIGKGKLEEVNEYCHENDVQTLIFNDNLSPSQAKNIAKITNCKAID
ncbi:MAG: hypothetical protein P9L91_07455 [Candidatus Zophobacter franzmannii]|jgi:GTP-binding protein HflX|nr:hypothetical protein [Candidatus Zophobacter franzmannii]